MSWAAVAGVAGSVVGGMLDKETGEEASSSTQQAPRLTPEQQELLRKMIAELMGQGSFQTTPYTGDLVADLSNLEKTSLTGLEQRALELMSGGNRMDKTANDALVRQLSGQPIATDDFIKTNVEEPATRYFRESLLPELEGRFRGSNLYSGQMREQEMRGVRDVGETVNRTSADIRFKSAQDAQSRVLAALGLYPEVSTLPLAQLGMTLEAGGIPRGVQQAKLSSQYDEFLRQQKDKTARLLAALGVPATENITTVNAASPGIFGGQGSSVGYLTGRQIAKYLS